VQPTPQSQPPGFQPTYEELKRNGVADGSSKLPGFQPTYEELKPQTFGPITCREAVFPAYL